MITLSMSAIATYMRCKQKFNLRHRKGWEDIAPEREALVQGTAFHAYMEQYARKQAGMPFDKLDWATPMGEVAMGYIQARWRANLGFILSVDEPQYVQITPDCRLRTTFDLVYGLGTTLVIRDYKTFERVPSMDVDLDFQAHTYLWAATQIWPGYDSYMFEHEYVRRTLPGVPKDKAGNCWTEDDCYKRQQMILSPDELEEDGLELKQIVKEILNRDVHSGWIWYREPLKGGGYDQCSSCSVKNLCIAGKQGNLNNEEAYLSLATKKETIYEIAT